MTSSYIEKREADKQKYFGKRDMHGSMAAISAANGFEAGFDAGFAQALEDVDLIFKTQLLAVKEIILHCDAKAQSSAVNIIDQALTRFNQLTKPDKADK